MPGSVPHTKIGEAASAMLERAGQPWYAGHPQHRDYRSLRIDTMRAPSFLINLGIYEADQ